MARSDPPSPLSPGPRRLLASALLLLGAGFQGGSLFLPWGHYTQSDGTPFANPSDAQTVTPTITFGLGDGRVQVLLWCAGGAIGLSLVALVLPQRTLGWLAPVVVAVGLAGLAFAYLIGVAGTITDAAVGHVNDGGYYLYVLGGVLILAGAWALVAARTSRTLAP